MQAYLSQFIINRRCFIDGIDIIRMCHSGDLVFLIICKIPSGCFAFTGLWTFRGNTSTDD